MTYTAGAGLVGIFIRRVADYAPNDFHNDNNIIQGNRIVNLNPDVDVGSDHGIYIRDGSNNSIIDNKMINMGWSGFTLESQEGVSAYNHIAGNSVLNPNQEDSSTGGGVGIWLWSNGGTIAHTSVVHNGLIRDDLSNSHMRYGVSESASGVDYTTISGNTIVGPETGATNLAGSNSRGFNNSGETSNKLAGGLDLLSDLEITDATKGIIRKSPNGTRWRETQNDDGSVTRTAL